MSVGQMSVGLLSCRLNVLSAKRLSAKSLSAKSLSAKCLSANCPSKEPVLRFFNVSCSQQICRMNLWMKKRRVTFHTCATCGNSLMDYVILHFIVARRPTQTTKIEKGVVPRKRVTHLMIEKVNKTIWRNLFINWNICFTGDWGLLLLIPGRMFQTVIYEFVSLYYGYYFFTPVKVVFCSRKPATLDRC